MSQPMHSSHISPSSMDADDVKEQEILNRSSESQVNLNQSMYDQQMEYKLKLHLPPVKLPYEFGPVPVDDKKVFFFDIDNCLYRRSTRIHDLMQVYIHRYFKKHLHLNDEDAQQLHMKYYKQYGLALEGLVRLHKVDALEYNKVVDDALPLDRILIPNPQLRQMLIDLKKSGKIDRLWLFTNAYKNHGLRVIHLLGIGDLFDGMSFCDYENFPLVCKPMKGAFDKALVDAGVSNPKNAYFIDDSEINVKAAKEFGWGKVIQYVELDQDLPRDLNNYSNLEITLIRSILDVRSACKELFI